jgi:uncharacterized protein YjbJ (UPF0337 family)
MREAATERRLTPACSVSAHVHSRISRDGLQLVPTAILQEAKGDRVMGNRSEGTKHQVKGGMKEGWGKATGNASKEAEGKLEKNLGKGQKEIGKKTDS